MREILFRGKRVDNGEWVYGYFVKKCDVDAGLSDFYIVDVFEFSQSSDYCGRIGDCVHSVIPETVGQYTGLTDKNGKKIFEGDIIQYTPWYSEETRIEGVIVAEQWNCSCCGGVFGFAVNGNGDLRNHTDYEVVGNIHDNPELIGGE